nr:MAG TPA: hypothetical protein [Caudoviricetes sp.]
MTENKITETLEVSNMTEQVTDTTITEPAPKQKPKRGRKKADAEPVVSENATTTTTEIAVETEPEKVVPVSSVTESGIKAGKTYTNENGIRLYASCVATNPAYRYMGSVAIWSDDTINNRVRITDACIHAGIHSKLIGWVNIDELGDEINV